MHSRLKAVFKRSPLGMTISDAMAEEYQQLFGLRFMSIMNCTDIPAECPPPPERATGEPLRFAFIGGLHNNRWQSLCEIGKSLIEMRAKGLSAVLDIYAPKADILQYGVALREVDSLYIQEDFLTDELPAALLRSDILVHVESFDEDSRLFFRLSLSTKVPFYLSMGRPILCYGPAEINTCRYLQDSQAGLVVGSQDQAALGEAIWQLGSRDELRRDLGRRAWEQASRQHDEKTVCERFRSLLAEAADSAKAKG
jgi:glycosyltransferase involved in cell wall biosynthesis